MVPLLVVFLVAFEVADVTAVGYNISASAEGTAKCNHRGFDPHGNDNGNVSIIHRRYGDRPPNKLLEELVLATVPVIKGNYTVRGTGEGGNLGSRVKIFLHLAFTCGGLRGVREVQIPDSFIVQIPDGIFINVPPKFFQHDFDVRFYGPGRR